MTRAESGDSYSRLHPMPDLRLVTVTLFVVILDLVSDILVSLVSSLCPQLYTVLDMTAPRRPFFSTLEAMGSDGNGLHGGLGTAGDV